MHDTSSSPGALFLTGVTGFLGRALLEEILNTRSFSTLYVLAKAQKDPPQSAFDRLHALAQGIALDRGMHLSVEEGTLLLTAPGASPIRLHVIHGNITLPDLGIPAAVDFAPVTHVCHAAAVTELAAPWETFLKVNVTGTHNLLQFAARRLPNLQRFAYVGTAYDVYDGRGSFLPALPPQPPAAFVNEYSHSKWMARQAVVASGLPCCICLPSILTGRSTDGFLPPDVPLGVIYGPLQGMALLKSICAPYLAADGSLTIDFHTPGDPQATLNVIPVDTAAALLNRILCAPRVLPGEIFYLANPQLLSIQHILEIGSSLLQVKGVRFASALAGRTPLEKLFARILLPYQPFMTGRDSLCDLSNTLQAAPGVSIPAPDRDFLERMFRYAHFARQWGYNQPASFYKDANIRQLQTRFAADIRSLVRSG